MWWMMGVASRGLVVLTLVTLGAALSLSAMAVHGQVPGNNGTVKIHATPLITTSNQPPHERFPSASPFYSSLKTLTSVRNR